MFHARLHNTIPPEFHLMLNHMNQVISKHTKQKWSKLLWLLVDREFHAFQRDPIQLSIKNGAEYFELMFSVSKSARQIFPLRNNELTDEVIAIILDMVKNKEVWEKLFKVKIDDLINPYRFYIYKMRQFVKTNNVDNGTELFNFKFRCFCAAESDKEYEYG